jgi:hypothetical protein
MIDALLSRAQLAIEESRYLRWYGRTLRYESMRTREDVRAAVLASAMAGAEMRAIRDHHLPLRTIRPIELR